MQEGQNRKTSSLSILAIAGVEPYQEKPGEEYMNEAQLAHFKRILEAWRNQLRDEVDRTVTHMQDEAANFLTRSTVPLRKKSSASNCVTVTASAN